MFPEAKSIYFCQKAHRESRCTLVHLAPLIAILNAVRRAVQRDLGTFQSIQVNNFFLFIALLCWGAFASGVEPVSAEPFLLLLSLLLLFPLSADPLQKIPATRLASWPLSPRQRFLLRVASAALSPVVWLAVVLVALTARPLLAVVLVAAALVLRGFLFIAARTLRRLPSVPRRWRLPKFRGGFSGLIHGNVRQMLSVLDTYAAVVLSAAGTGYRWFAKKPDPSAFPILSILVALVLSTHAQTLFELDGAAGVTRYRLLPLRGWQILLAKDAAFLGVLLLLISPLGVGSGLTFGLVAVAVGRFPSLSRLPRSRSAPPRWRFTSGDLRFGVPQIVVATALGFAEAQRGAPFFLIAAAVYLLSLYAAGRYWDVRVAATST